MNAAIGQPDRPASVPTTPFLAADVGGTHARVALMRASRDGERGVEALAYRKFACADFAGLAELLQAFVGGDVRTPVRHCVLACAGQVVGDEVLNDNSAWPIHLPSVRRALALDEVAVLNDFEALGYALDRPLARSSRLLCGPDIHVDGPILVIGPGTGLGAALRLPGPAGGCVLASEAGQMDFAPNSARERELLARLAPEGGYVAYERIVSGPGLLTVYETLCGLHGATPRLATPEAVTAAAAARGDAQAMEAGDLLRGAGRFRRQPGDGRDGRRRRVSGRRLPFLHVRAARAQRLRGTLPARAQRARLPVERPGQGDGTRAPGRAGRGDVVPPARRAWGLDTGPCHDGRGSPVNHRVPSTPTPCRRPAVRTHGFAQWLAATRIDLGMERVAWRFGDEAKDAVVRLRAGAAGEIEIHADSCTGPLLARLPLAPAARASGQTRLSAAIATPPGSGARDLCIVATGDPRDGQPAPAGITFSRDGRETGVPQGERQTGKR